MKRMRGTGPLARAFFWGMIGAFAVLAALAAVAGWWLYSLISLVLGMLFVVSAPFVLGRAWRQPSGTPAPRPVVRRRR